MSWLEDLKVGDKVTVMPYDDKGEDAWVHTCTVSEVSSDYVRLENGLYFDKTTGTEKWKIAWGVDRHVSDNWIYKVMPYDQEAKLRIERRKEKLRLVNEVVRLAWGNYPLNVLRAVIELVRAYEEAEKND